MLKEYLNRINYTGVVSPEHFTLFGIHRNHLLSIPFENLEIHFGKKIILNKDHLYNKIIKNKRGGYCYELNGMLYLLLKETGFKVKMISAQVNIGENADNIWSQEFSHMALIVTFGENENYLCDVGFGDNFIEPLKFDINVSRKDPAGIFRIIKGDGEYFNLQNSQDGIEFKNSYRFTVKEREWKDFEEMNIYQQTSENSHFTKNRICSIATVTGRISLSSTKLTITENGEKKITELTDENDFKKKLREYFQIRL
ncbi:MAG: arylamine N-acetyltransferase [Bacteroidetes bacterium]|nr:arylamine N-acetyltransferase [Bacteroidota bacterium]